jgi:eukaryotic-like serine/threonine-protein kinase
LFLALSGHREPAGYAESLGLAWIYQDGKKHFARATSFYREAFAAEPKLTNHQPSIHRYNAACAAALAGCGQGKDAASLDEQERSRFRQLALDWLQADLRAWRKLLDKEPQRARPIVQQQMQHWQQDPDFGNSPRRVTHVSGTVSWEELVDDGLGLRSPAALAKLPEAERKDWQKLWKEVEALRRRRASLAGPSSHRITAG